MFESKYSKVLTIILIIVIIAIIGLLGFLAYDYYQNYKLTKEASDFVENAQEEDKTENNNNSEENNTTTNETSENPLDRLNDANTTNGSSTKGNSGKTYYGFGTLGTMEIPAINFKYPILDKVTKASIEKSVAFLYGTEINQPGNTVIVGHNYRNGVFFSNNKKLNIGDKIYIRDNSGKNLTYTIYDKFETTPEDTTFYQRDTGGKAEVTLSTCTDDSKARLIILARAD